MILKYFSAFSGIGGMELGIQYATLRPIQSAVPKRPKKQRSIKNKLVQWECVGYSEIDKYAIQIYQRHFPTHKNYGDITKLNVSKLPNHDLLVGGFPCQSFSIAGKRGGFEDTRGTLFFNLAEIAKVKKPRYLLFENVKGLLSHDEGNTFATIISTLDELGYDLQWQVLNSKDFGVPQNRERVFIVGHLRGESRPKVFPIGESEGLFSKGKKERKVKDKLSTTITQNLKRGVHSGGETLIYEGAILSEKNKKWLEDGKELSRNFPQGQRVYSTEGIASTIAGNAGGLGGKTGLYAVLTPDRPKKRQHGRRMKEDGEPMFTLTGQDKHGVSDGVKIRRLTPTECERLQGFPDGWTEGGIDKNGNEVMISDTQRYKV